MESLRKSALLLFALNLVLPQSLFALHETGKRLPKTADLLIIGGTVVTMDGDRRVIENGALAVTADRIVAIGTSQQLKSEFSAKRVIDAGGRVVIPGLVNTHTHIPMTLFRGLADDLDLQDWLTKHIFPAEAKYVNEEMVRVGTRLGLAELVRGGTTTFNDMYYFEDAIADETRKAGIRAVLGETLIDFPAPDNKTFDDALRYTEWFVSKWKASELIYPAVAPHAPYTVSKEHLLASKALADRHGVRVHIHLAEANTETEFIRQNHQGQRPIEFVENIGFLGDKMIAAHVVQADVSELEILKRRGVGIAHNPQSNMKLAAGVAPVPKMIELGLAVGLGTDGAASNNDLDLWEEMDTAAKLHKLYSGNPKAASAKQMFELATIGGARALHLESEIGSLEVGKRADIVIVDFDSLNQTPMYNLYSHLVYATKANNVRTVIINGRLIMLDRKLLTLNENVIKKDANLFRSKVSEDLKSH